MRLTLIAVALVAAAILYLNVVGPDYSNDDPAYSDLLAKMRVVDENTNAVIDFSDLNGGHWKSVCLFGGFTYPTRELPKIGAHVGWLDALKLRAFNLLTLRLGQVEEHELMVVRVDERERAHLVHFNDVTFENLRSCISKPVTRLIAG